jgi:hypothetical protein
MNAEELEDLLSRHPELAPSPDLEARIVRATRPRVRGMIPAAAALLFCIGVVVSMISTLSTPAGKGKREPDGPYRISFLKEEGKWKVFPPEFRDELPQAKGRGVAFVGPSDTPWGLIQHVRRACVKAQIPATEWRIGGQVHHVAAYVPVRQGQPDKVILEDIKVVMSRDRSGGLVRRIGDRKPVESEEELFPIILRMESDYRRAGKAVIPIVIDANGDVAWRDVASIIEKCRKEGFEEFNLDPPTTLFKEEEKLWAPDQWLFNPERK